MRKLLLLLSLSVFLFSSCNSSKKNLEKGNYDGAIVKSVKKLLKKPDDNKEAILLDKAYKLANEQDLDAIKFLKLDGQPDTWDRVLQHYELLKRRQQRLRPVLPLRLNGQMISYRQVDYDNEIIESKRKAASYFYTNGKRLLGSTDKLLIRQAYGEFLRAKSYAGSSYLDLDNLIREAAFRGISRVFVRVENMSLFNFPQEFMDEIISGKASRLNTDWVHYFFKHNDDQIEYDYLTVLKFRTQ